jgi:hypothetical protein
MLDNENEIFSSIHFHKDSTFDLVFEGDRLSASVILDRQQPGELARIEIRYPKIWTVARGDSAFFTGEDNIYINPDALDFTLSGINF